MNPFPSKVGDSPASSWDLLGLMPLQPELPNPPPQAWALSPNTSCFPPDPHQARVQPSPSPASRYFLQQLPRQGSFLFLGVGHREDQLAGEGIDRPGGGTLAQLPFTQPPRALVRTETGPVNLLPRPGTYICTSLQIHIKDTATTSCSKLGFY